jgi:hypothetical protein
MQVLFMMRLIQRWTLRGRKGTAQKGHRNGTRKGKKEEFPGLMQNMLPGNSFPQICVVSVHHLAESSVKIVVNTDRFPNTKG